MLAVSSPLFSPHQWPLEDPISLNHHHNSLFPPIEASDSFHLHQFAPPPPLQPPPFELDHYPSSTTPSPGGSATVSKMAKKLSHNASERDRRKKINSLYSSLRALLPSADQMKKLSNPATISRILSYIPELQQQVEGLMRKKEELMGAMTGQEVEGGEERKAKKCAASSSSSVISASRVSQQEMAVQISTDINDGHRNSLSEILVWLEEEGLSLLNASSFETFDGKVFHNLHVQMESSCRMEPEMLSNKLLGMFP
ncbi:transcription factor bHLH101-like isoform X1 [Momordica charantia]|uniref:Transcription factor bHLH101-like isoform X1 n=1 Tax=Momordica charantia TaxID=3673 RepID=A0A6J1DM57_MOMCH|nr:transcription factor bHLH101-like isoform X1 [Momordica charantia]